MQHMNSYDTLRVIFRLIHRQKVILCIAGIVTYAVLCQRTRNDTM